MLDVEYLELEDRWFALRVGRLTYSEKLPCIFTGPEIVFNTGKAVMFSHRKLFSMFKLPPIDFRNGKVASYIEAQFEIVREPPIVSKLGNMSGSIGEEHPERAKSLPIL